MQMNGPVRGGGGGGGGGEKKTVGTKNNGRSKS